MLDKEAEYKYFKEFKNFSIGFYDDCTLHYNHVEEENAVTYKELISELNDRLVLEIESNLIYLEGSKAKRLAYLNKLLEKIESLRIAIDEGYEVTLQSEVLIKTSEGYRGEPGFQNILWWHQIKITDSLVDFIGKLISTQNSIGSKRGGRKAVADEKIVWLKDRFTLRRLFFEINSNVGGSLRSNKLKFIGDISFTEFEKHFIAGSDKAIVKINWLKDKYMLVVFLDALFERKLIDSNYHSIKSKLISSHFLFKGKPITNRQITSSRNTLAHKTTSLPKEKSAALAFLYNIIKNLHSVSKSITNKH